MVRKSQNVNDRTLAGMNIANLDRFSGCYLVVSSQSSTRRVLMRIARMCRTYVSEPIGNKTGGDRCWDSSRIDVGDGSSAIPRKGTFQALDY